MPKAKEEWIVLNNGLCIKAFRAPCNISTKNVMEYDFQKGLVCIRFKCGKIKWKRKGYTKCQKL